MQPSTGDGSEERPLDIVREDRKLKNIITQSALVGVLARDHVIESLQPFMSRSLADLGLVQGPKKVLCADLDDDVLSACRLMVDNVSVRRCETACSSRVWVRASDASQCNLEHCLLTTSRDCPGLASSMGPASSWHASASATSASLSPQDVRSASFTALYGL